MKIEILSTTQEKANGLQFRESLPKDTILLFKNISPNSEFHMKNCRFPIDIASVNGNGLILNIARINPDIGRYTTHKDTQDVIEANIDFFKENNYNEGDKIIFAKRTSTLSKNVDRWLRIELEEKRKLQKPDMADDIATKWVIDHNQLVKEKGSGETWGKEKQQQYYEELIQKSEPELRELYATVFNIWPRKPQKDSRLSKPIGVKEKSEPEIIQGELPLRLSNKRDAQLMNWIKDLRDKYLKGDDTDKEDIMTKVRNVAGITGIALLLGIGYQIKTEHDLEKILSPKDKQVYEQVVEQPNDVNVKAPTIQVQPTTQPPVPLSQPIQQVSPKTIQQPPKQAPKDPFREHIETHSEKHDINPALVAKVIRQESQYNPKAKSNKGAKGLMQIMPNVWDEITDEMGVDWDYKTNVYDPHKNTAVGIHYLGKLARWVDSHPELKGKRNELILAAYNAGPNTVLKYKGVPPYKETKNYIRKILRKSSKTA